MKKFLALALAAAMSLSLVACGGGSSNGTLPAIFAASPFHTKHTLQTPIPLSF